jgi:hypothetical protein
VLQKRYHFFLNYGNFSKLKIFKFIFVPLDVFVFKKILVCKAYLLYYAGCITFFSNTPFLTFSFLDTFLKMLFALFLNTQIFWCNIFFIYELKCVLPEVYTSFNWGILTHTNWTLVYIFNFY